MTFTKVAKTTSNWSKVGKIFPLDYLLLQTGSFMLLQDESKMIKTQYRTASWTKVAK